MGGCCSLEPPSELDLKSEINGKKRLCIWILGGPGCGKGTQCEKLSAKFSLVHLSTGDMLRAEVEKKRPLGQDIKQVMEHGDLVSTQLVIQLLTNEMESSYYSCRGYLIDGYPREVEQGELFCNQIGEPHIIIYLECPDDVLMERLLQRGKASGRVDDNEVTIKSRLKTFHNISQPVLNKWSSKVKTVDGARSPEEVTQQCVKVVENYLESI